MWDTMDKPTEAYTYEPLPPPSQGRTIRLLVLDVLTDEADDENAPLTASIETHPLASAPPYDAISYVWGDDPLDAWLPLTIACRGKFSTVPISPNLDWALRRSRSHVRGTSSRIWIWADAVCINQTDIAERSAQVAFMGAIFSSARRVFVCVGDPPTEKADAAVAKLVKVATFLQNAEPDEAGEQARITADVLLHSRVSWWTALNEFLCRPWFKRVWVIQEVGLAKDPLVLYGRKSFGYRETMRTVSWAGTQELMLYGLANLLIHSEWPDWTLTKSERTFYDLLDHGSMLSCRDPRDRVYAFLGHPLARRQDSSCEEDRPIIIPDYSKSLGELYLEVTELCLRMVGLRALVAVEHTEKSLVDGYPSWVTRWHINNKRNNILHLPKQLFAAGGPDHTACVPHIEGALLRLSGAIADTLWRCFQIQLTGIDSPLSVNSPFGISFLNNARDPATYVGLVDMTALLTSENTLRMYRDAPTLIEALAVTLCGGIPRDLSSQIPVQGLLQLMSPSAMRRLQLDPTTLGSTSVLMYLRLLAGKCYGRVFAVTEMGRYCLVPRLARPGDEVCVIRGIDVPFITRTDGTRRVLIEEAYVHGLMQEEAMDMIAKGKLVEQELTIQ
ncbi:heterokaryon incompatibility protein-domain-containing protein [Echria macrotheca]|uniref:Heterokaryon incompatibility protein-domain-containing protein n=1 Tax=Echria macrotheca TaxID=438768 RepID=A0AAJ0F177_9PEZI|nr:heterokaryon incompatibility protein-domain-containing protein [Echria macrotheca]